MELEDLIKKLPGLQKLLTYHGDTSVFEYAQSTYQGIVSRDPHFLSRKQEFLMLLDNFCEQYIGGGCAKSVRASLDYNYCVSTAEHHGPHGHPFFWQSTLLRAIVSEAPPITFATTHVSLGNSSYPRGLLVSPTVSEQTAILGEKYLHLPFFPAADRMNPVFGMRQFTAEDIFSHTFSALRRAEKVGIVSPKRAYQIQELITETTLSSHILSQPTYSQQIILMNQSLWRRMMPTIETPVSLPAENIIIHILLDHLRRTTDLSRFLTDLALQSLIEEKFDGIQCCFDLRKKSGTYLFWYLDEYHHRHALWRDGAELVSTDHSFRMQINSDEYIYHLTHGHLIPSGLLVYSIFSCYYGLTCFGGFSQGGYLPRIHDAFSYIFMKLSDTFRSFQTVPDGFCEDINLLMHKDIPITPMDFLMSSSDQVDLSELAHKKTIRQSIREMMYDIDHCL